MLEDDRIINWSFTEESPDDEAIRKTCMMGKNLSNGSSDPLAIGYEDHKQ